MFVTNKEIYKTNTKTLLENINQIHVLEYYLNTPIVLNENIVSPIRHDPNPGCRFAIDKESNLILFDYSRGTSHNVVDVVANKIGVSYVDALYEINKNFVVRNISYTKPEKLQAPERIPFQIFIKRQEFNEEDLGFWNIGDVKFTTEELINYNIVRLAIYSINNMVFKPDLAYLFNFPKFKQVYRPTLSKNGRGVEARYRSDTMLGLHIVGIENYDYLIVTKSCRDGIYVHKLGFNAAFVLKEGHVYTNTEIAYLIKFKKVILLYDGDTTGIKNMEKWKNRLNAQTFNYVEKKDTVEMLENFEQNYVKQILWKEIQEDLF